MNIHVMRLKPDQDLERELVRYLEVEGVQAGVVLTAVGSLKRAQLRLANQEKGTNYQGYFEIVSLVGTLSEEGSHLHISLADQTGKVIGGHLLGGCQIYTTAEIVLGIFPELEFKREMCQLSGYPELVITSSSSG